jgi:hypothetical protein
MPETVKFDILGDRRLIFDHCGVTYITKEMYAVPLPGWLFMTTIVTNRPIRYQDIRWVGPIRRKQWWALGLGVIFLPLGLFWMAAHFGNWSAFAVAVFTFVVLGMWPFWLFLQGRTFLAIASDKLVICFPMDRKKKQVRRALVLLKGLLASQDVRWDIEEI